MSRALFPLLALLWCGVLFGAAIYAFDHPSTWPESYPRHLPAAFTAERTLAR